MTDYEKQLDTDAPSDMIELTEGENLILTKLEQLEELVQELVEKVNNINLVSSDDLTIEAY